MTAEPRFRDPLKKNRYRVIDGDTVEVEIDRGHNDAKVLSIRILGTDAPESNTRRNPLEREAGKLVTKVVEQWMLDRIETRLYASSEVRPKYAGRTIGRIWPEGGLAEGDELSAFLLEGGFVRPYDGGTRDPWPDDHLHAIIAACHGHHEAQPPS